MERKGIIGAYLMLAFTSSFFGAGLVPRVRAETKKSSLLRLTVISAKSYRTFQAGKITSPTVAARRLYNAWKVRNRRLALKVASPEAVSKLFSVRWRPMRLRGCENDNGSFECIYRDAKLDLDLAMVVEGGASAGYHVETVSFSSEAAFLPVDNPPKAVSMDKMLAFKN